MNKNNAFTLIELLGVLILLAVIALITFPIIDKTLLGAKNEAYERQKDSIIESARLYVTENGDYNTSRTRLNFQTLKDAGFLKDGDILDPRDPSKEMPGCVIYNWDESNKQYVFEYSEDCLPSTPGECFTYEDIETNIESFDINYSECVMYMSNLGLPGEFASSLCRGEDIDGFDIKEAIKTGDLDINDLKSNNVITNVIETKKIEITGYDNTCGGMNVILPQSIDGKDIISIGSEAFGKFSGGDAFNDINQDNYFLINNNISPNLLINSIDMSEATELKTIKGAAFYGNQLTKITFPNSITTMENYAFSLNQLTSVTIPDSVTTIGSSTFFGNQLASVTIPDSVTTIGSGAFDENQLTSVIIPNNLDELESGVFENNQLTSITIPDSVTMIGYSAFENNQLFNITIPNKVKIISGRAFLNNQLTNVTIPNSVTTIGDLAFYNNQITDIVLGDNIQYIDTSTFKENPVYDDSTEEFLTINNILLKYNGNSTTVTIPNYVKNIGGNVFYDKNITSVTIPNSVTTIGYEAFKSNDLTSVTIPNSVTTIGYSAFSYNKLTNVVIPDSITTIERSAFSINELTSITIPDSVIEIGNDAFSGNQLTSVTIPKSVMTIGGRAFYKYKSTNPLTTITNQTGKSFNWGNIINGKVGYYFETGTVVNEYGNVQITK